MAAQSINHSATTQAPRLSYIALEAALWCFHTTDSFSDAVLTAANLGDDADTTAAITGQIAGAFHGLEGIPDRWRDLLHDGARIEKLARDLAEVAGGQ